MPRGAGRHFLRRFVFRFLCCLSLLHHMRGLQRSPVVDVCLDRAVSSPQSSPCLRESGLCVLISRTPLSPSGRGKSAQREFPTSHCLRSLIPLALARHILCPFLPANMQPLDLLWSESAPVDSNIFKMLAYFVLAIVGLCAIILLLLWPYLSTEMWRALLFSVALLLNLILCAVQAVVLTNLWEYSKDHMNHYDVEDSMRRLVMPEQVLQVLLAGVHVLNRSLWHSALQCPLAAWHVYNMALARSPVQTVLGREDQFQKDLIKLRHFYIFKAFFYIASLGLCLMSAVPLYVHLFVSSHLVTSFIGALKNHVEMTHRQAGQFRNRGKNAEPEFMRVKT